MLNLLSRCAAPGLFRLILALVVFTHHTTRINLGSAAVYIFFILSGFWISTMWTKRYSLTRWSYATYLVSRSWRLLPVFFLCSSIAWILLFFRGAIPDLTDSYVHQAFSNAFILGYNGLSYQANVPAWSLDIEMQFYLVAPLMIALMTRRVWAVLVACAIVSIGANLLNAPASVAHYIVFFAVGAAAAGSGWRPGWRLATGSLFSTLSTVLICLASPWRDIVLGGANPGPLHALNSVLCQLLGLTMAPWAIYTAQRKGTPIDRLYGDLAFIVYLLHWPVLGVIHTGEGSYLQRSFAIGEALVVTLVASVLIWRLFDHPLNQVRSTWVAGRLASNAQEVSTATA